MCKEHSYKWQEIEKQDHKNRTQRAPPLKRKNGKKVLGQVVDHAHRTFNPTQRNQIVSKDIALEISALFHQLSQLHIVEHFEPQCLICPNRVINLPANQVESAHAHVVFCFRVGNFPWPMPEYKQALEESNHHAFSGAVHDHAWKQHNVIGPLSIGITQRSIENIRPEEHIRIR